MHRRLSLLAATLLLPGALLATSTQAGEANVVYVTDELRLGLYRTEETNGRTLKTLISGARLEVLERSLMSIQVRTEEGDEGWVKTAYIVTKEPARRRVAALEGLQAETAAALADAQNDLAATRADAEGFNARLIEAEQNLVELPNLTAENETLKAALNQGSLRVPVIWMISAAVISLLLGVLLGYWWLDRKVRGKFGGVRPY